MLKLCAQTATVYVCGKADYTWRWEKAILIVASIKLRWCNSEFPNKRGQLAGHQITFKQTPGLCSWFPRWTRKGTFFRIRPVVRSDCTVGTVKWNLGEYARRVWGKGKKTLWERCGRMPPVRSPEKWCLGSLPGDTERFTLCVCLADCVIGDR